MYQINGHAAKEGEKLHTTLSNLSTMLENKTNKKITDQNIGYDHHIHLLDRKVLIILLTTLFQK